MDRELVQFIRENKSFLREWDSFYREFQTVKRELTEMRREVGVREGRIMADQMDDLEQDNKHNIEQLSHIRRDVTAIRKILGYNEINMKELKKALALIYRNVDELEEGLLPNPSS